MWGSGVVVIVCVFLMCLRLCCTLTVVLWSAGSLLCAVWVVVGVISCCRGVCTLL